MPKNAKKYYCTKCDFGTDKMSNYNNHLSTRKHSMEIYGNKKMPKCKICKIQFKSNSGLWKHEKKCFQGCKDSVTNINKQNNTHKEIDDTTQDSKNIVLELITQNQDFKDLLLEQNKQFQILQDKNHELTEAYKELQTAQAELVEKEKLEHELSMAHTIQNNILPKELPHTKTADIGAKMVPARAVGGDFYDVIILSEDEIGIAIGDVSDKGVAAAMFMAQVCTLLRVQAQHIAEPEKVLKDINTHLLKTNDSGMFVTMIYGIYNTKKHTFNYARAGHEVPIIFDKKGNATEPDHGPGMPLCLFPDPPYRYAKDQDSNWFYHAALY